MAEPTSKTTAPPAPAPGGAGAESKTAPKLRYRVNWSLLGFLGKDHKAGTTVKATEAEAAPFLGKALSLIKEA